jgi:hypothetical protein
MSYLDDVIDKLEAFADRYGRPLGYNIIKGKNDKHDAFRHGFISAAGTMKFSSGMVGMVGIAGDAYEVNGWWEDSQEADIRNMDLWNNYKGREIGRVSSSYTEAANLVHQAILAKELITDPNDKRNYFKMIILLRYGIILKKSKQPLPWPPPTTSQPKKVEPSP